MISLRRVASLVALVGICGLGLVGCGGEEPTDSLAMPPGPPPGMGDMPPGMAPGPGGPGMEMPGSPAGGPPAGPGGAMGAGPGGAPGAAAAPATPGESADPEALEKGIDLNNEGRTAEALAIWKAALKKHPGDEELIKRIEAVEGERTQNVRGAAESRSRTAQQQRDWAEDLDAQRKLGTVGQQPGGGAGPGTMPGASGPGMDGPPMSGPSGGGMSGMPMSPSMGSTGGMGGPPPMSSPGPRGSGR